MTPDDGEAILVYIRQSRGTYTREAITQQLRDAGYAPAAIDAAWVRIAAEAAPAMPPVRRLSTGTAIAVFVIVWVGLSAALGVFQILVSVALSGLNPTPGNPEVRDRLNLLFVVFVVGLLAGGVVLLLRRLSLGWVLAVAGVAAFVWVVVVYGACQAALQ